MSLSSITAQKQRVLFRVRLIGLFQDLSLLQTKFFPEDADSFLDIKPSEIEPSIFFSNSVCQKI